MQMGGLMGGFYRFSEWVMKLAYINLLWILFTILGLIVFGIMPATIAMFTVIRKFILGDKDIPVFKTFFTAYKKEFLKGNIIGVFITIFGYILYIDLQYLAIVDGTLHTILLSALFLAGILYILFLLYIIPVYVHYDLKFKQYFKYAVMIGIGNFHISILMVIGLTALYYLVMKVPGIMPFFSASLAGLIIMWFANLAFNILLSKKEKLEAKQEQKDKRLDHNTPTI